MKGLGFGAPLTGALMLRIGCWGLLEGTVRTLRPILYASDKQQFIRCLLNTMRPFLGFLGRLV